MLYSYIRDKLPQRGDHTMKMALIKVFVMPGGVALLVGICLLSLILTYAPPSRIPHQAKQDRDEFPDQRRGGGTHWDNTPDDVA